MCFKAKQHFYVSNGKTHFFHAACVTKVKSFRSKQKMFLSDRRTDYLEILWFQYVLKIKGPKMAPQVGQISEILKKWNIDQFQSYFSYKGQFTWMKRNNFSGSLFKVDFKTPMKFWNWGKNDCLVLHSILGVFHLIQF